MDRRDAVPAAIDRDGGEPEPDHRGLAAGHRVAAIHEIEQVEEPEPQHARRREIERARQPALEHRWLIGERDKPEQHGAGLHRQPRQHAEAAEIVPPGDRGQQQRAGKERRRQPDRPSVKRGRRGEGGEQQRHEDEPAAARHGGFVVAARTRTVEDRETPKLPQRQPAEREAGEQQREKDHGVAGRRHGRRYNATAGPVR